MCGIVGALIFKNSKFTITEPYITRMRDTMLHRGPDRGGTWVGENGRVGLAHRRLSIIDLSEAASQPMCNEDGTLWITYNGEIYNHSEIRSELEATGRHFWKTSHSDTEVILHAFEEWGIECLSKFRGMFGFALWDAKNRELWLVRDRIGIKPVYYSIHDDRIVFASEIKALLHDPDQKREVNEDAFYHYLSFLTTPAPQTMFDGIKKLPGGCWLRVSPDGGLHEKRYWDVWEHAKPLIGYSEDDIARMLLEELKIAVSLRKVSDVPVGVFLSGGLDSSTNAALFSECGGEPVKTFSIGYDKEYQTYQNELHYAQKMAGVVGAKYHERLLSIDDLINFLPKMVYLQDEPIADPVCVPLYYVSKLARDNGVIVCQVGEGADELFIGYPGWERQLTVQNLSEYFPFPWLEKAGVNFLKHFSKFRHSFRLDYLRRAGEMQPIFWGGAVAFPEIQKKDILSPRFRKWFKGYSSWEAIKPIHERFMSNAWEKSNLSWMTYLDLNFRLPELLLMRVDKMSMGVSLEARVPFLDQKFVELAMSIPSALKINNGTLKYILKKAVRGTIPDEIIDRKKQGFSLPMDEWFLDTLGERARAELDSFCDRTDFFDKGAVMRLIEQRQGWKVWFILNFAMWWDKQVKA